MVIKNSPPMNLFCFSTETSLIELSKYVRVKANEIYSEAVKNNLEITGPVYWIYEGMDGNPTTQFKLDIGIPVQSDNCFASKFSCKSIKDIKVATIVHDGAWNNLPMSYEKLITELIKSGLTLSGVAREVYLNIDFENPENNVTEIQLGIKS